MPSTVAPSPGTSTPRPRVLLNTSPAERHLTLDQSRAVQVDLSGSKGIGRSMVLDAEVWAEMRDTYGAAWSLIANSDGRLYVRASRGALKEAAGQPSASTASLARLIVGAQRGEVVIFRDGDTLNLRRSNLLRLTSDKAAKWHREILARV